MKSLKADVSSVTPSTNRSDERLTLETSAFKLFTLANLRCFILPPTQHHSFFRNFPPLFIFFLMSHVGNNGACLHAVINHWRVRKRTKKTKQNKSKRKNKTTESLGNAFTPYWSVLSCTRFINIYEIILISKNLPNKAHQFFHLCPFFKKQKYKSNNFCSGISAYYASRPTAFIRDFVYHN